MAKKFKIAERQIFMKYIKKYKKYEDPKISYFFSFPSFDTREEAESYLEDKVLNNSKWNPTNARYEKVEGNLYKLVYEGDKTFRYISFDICEFDLPNDIEEKWNRK